MHSQKWALANSTHLWRLAGSIVITIGVSLPVEAQIPLLPHNLQPPASSANELDNRVISGWIYLDGRRLFRIAAPRANFSERLEDIQQNLAEISQNYLQVPSSELSVEVRTLNGLPVIYINNRYLLTVTEQDGRLQQLEPSILASELSQTLQQALTRAKQERQTSFLIQQSKIAAGTGLVMILLSWLVYRFGRRSMQQTLQPAYPSEHAAEPIKSQLTDQQRRNLKEVKRRLFQLAQAAIWGSGTLTILGLFPYTRPLQLWTFVVLQVPLKLAIVGVLTYVTIRLSYALVDRFTSAIASSALLTPEASERLQLRVSTISSVTKGITTITCIVVGSIVALAALGIDIVPLLAGASIVGVAVSLASQNIIKDAINGFLIVLEDQYAIGDVIAVGQVAGFVEALNLRITQLRDGEGRLITIPNSEIKIVANLSSRWSRADLNIPVAYQANIDEVLKLIETVGFEMDKDPQWQEQILEPPQVLGVDNFGERGLVVRVWIKTQPLKQWPVAREYRRRLKIAFDKAGIEIPLPQQAIWLNDTQSLSFKFDGQKVRSQPHAEILDEQ